MAMSIDHWWGAAKHKAHVEKQQEIEKAKLLACCIADLFEQRGLVVRTCAPNRLDNPDAPKWRPSDN